MAVLFRSSFKTVFFRTLLKVAIATSNFMNAIYNGGFVTEISVSMLKGTIVLV